jgi:hypothetical protein
MSASPNDVVFNSHPEPTARPARWRAPRQHVKRAVRTLRYAAYRARRELSDGFGRAFIELRHAFSSARVR